MLITILVMASSLTPQPQGVVSSIPFPRGPWVVSSPLSLFGAIAILTVLSALGIKVIRRFYHPAFSALAMSVRAKAFGVRFPVNGLRLKQLKIPNRVIAGVFVFMVDYLGREKWSTNVRRHDVAMFKNLFAINAHSSIAVSVNSASLETRVVWPQLSLSVTGLRAKELGTLFNLGFAYGTVSRWIGYLTSSHDLNLRNRLGLWLGSFTVQPVFEPFSL